MRDSSFWNVIVPRVLGTYANVIFLVLWVGFIIALIVNREWLDVLWNWAQALPMVLRIIVWVLFLPIMVGLWIWESTLLPAIYPIPLTSYSFPPTTADRFGTLKRVINQPPRNNHTDPAP